MNALQKIIILIIGLVFVGIIATVGIFALVAGAIVVPLLYMFKPRQPLPPSEEAAKPLENTIDAEFTRVDKD